MCLSSKVTTIKTVKQMDELVDIGTDTPVWQRYRLKIMSLSQQVSEQNCMVKTISAYIISLIWDLFEQLDLLLCS